MKTFCIFILTLILGYADVQAQDPIDIRLAISKEIGNYVNWHPILDKRKAFAYFFAIAVSYDKDGNVDTAYFTDKLETELRVVLNPKLLARKLMESRYLPRQYKNKIVMYPVLYKYAPDLTVPFNENLKQSWLNLWPVLAERHRKKELVLLQPFEHTFYIIDN